MMASTFSDEVAVSGLIGLVGVRVTGVAGNVHDRLAEHAAGLVDLLHGKVDTGELGWSEERQDAGLRQQRADRHDAVTLAGAFDRHRLGERALALDDDELGERRVDAVVVADLQQAVAGDRRFAVAVELQRPRAAVVVDVLAGVDEVACTRRTTCTSCRRG